MSYLGDYHSWHHAHKQAIYRRDHDAATRSRIVYAVTNDRLTRDTARHVFELLDDFRKSDAENHDRVSHILGMRPTAEADAPDLLAFVQAIAGCVMIAESDKGIACMNPNEIIDRWILAARAALAKAKGVTS